MRCRRVVRLGRTVQSIPPRLEVGIQVLLTSRTANDLIDEIAARVWYCLVKDDYSRLRRFAAQQQGRFARYLAILARLQAYQHFRSERRRRQREQAVSRRESESSSQPCVSSGFLLEEFATILTARERDFFCTNGCFSGKARPLAWT